MRLILLDIDVQRRRQFFPISLSRPIWEMRCGMTTLGEKLIARTGATDVACFVPDYMAGSYAARTDRPVNDAKSLAGDDLLLVDCRVKAESFDIEPKGASEVGVTEDGRVVYARIASGDLAKLKTDSIESFLASAAEALPKRTCDLPAWNYTWDLILTGPEQITEDFRAAGRDGIEGTVEEPGAIRGSKKDVYVAPGAAVHPMVVFDAENGPDRKSVV